METEIETIPLQVPFNQELGNPLLIRFTKDIDTEKRIIRGYATTEALKMFEAEVKSPLKTE